ncbi:DUF2207 domain-containing protein [Microbacteriaceae bacterium VKM Ac-2855]|nr:DUF2207 domain-containing protein [Microbacteriaceae bacterium VKM Ac-2855]
MTRIPAVLAVLLLVLIGAPLASADTDDFRFANYDVVYDLGRDADGHSALTTTETFVAVFPEIDQNRGMRRAIPTSFDGHPTEVDLVSVTDENGAARPVDTETDDGFLIVTSAADDYVHGEQTYVFTYTQRNVTLSADETASGQDEFYWDTNGTGWAQPFDAYSVRVVADPGLAQTGSVACYRGAAGSTQGCEIAADGTVTGVGLAPGENVTVAIGFEPSTFTPRDDSYFGSPWAYLQLFGFVVALAALVGAIVLRATLLRDARGRGTVIAEYDPPPASIFSAAEVVGKTSKATAAAFVDLAVRGVLQIEERTTTGLFGREKEHYVLRLIDPNGVARRRFVRPRDLTADEREFVSMIFGSTLVPGTERDLEEKDAEFGKNLTAFMTGLPGRVKAEGLRRKRTGGASAWAMIAAFVGAGLTIGGGAALLVDDRGGVVPLVLMIASFVSIFVVCILVIVRPLTRTGAELREHLEGLELYIRLAEADRLAMLQSPEGAQRRVVDSTEIVALTERLLPYAVLFGLEQEWAKELAVAYEQAGTDPGWYAGSHGFNAALFAGSLSSFSSTATSTWSGSATSSSSGGASGGGSSGGGGGGGGGGGV